MKHSLIPKYVIIAAVTLSITACSSETVQDEKNDLLGHSGISATSHSILEDNADPIYVADSFVDIQATGTPQSYEDLQDFIKPYESVNFLKYEIISQYTPEEAYEFSGDDMFLYGATLYDIHVTYDYMNSQPLDIYTRLSSAGTPESQFEGFPPYLPGEVYACFLPDFDENQINYEFSELLFAIDCISEDVQAYHLGFEKINFVDQTGKSIADSDFSPLSVITSTRNNPVYYVKKIQSDKLVEYLYNDWLSRDYDFQTSFRKTKEEHE